MANNASNLLLLVVKLVGVVHPVPHDGGEEESGDSATDRHVFVSGRREAVSRPRDECLVDCDGK